MTNSNKRRNVFISDPDWIEIGEAAAKVGEGRGTYIRKSVKQRITKENRKKDVI